MLHYRPFVFLVRTELLREELAIKISHALQRGKSDP
jgi:hypothetical protein